MCDSMALGLVSHWLAIPFGPLPIKIATAGISPMSRLIGVNRPFLLILFPNCTSNALLGCYKFRQYRLSKLESPSPKKPHLGPRLHPRKPRPGRPPATDYARRLPTSVERSARTGRTP